MKRLAFLAVVACLSWGIPMLKRIGFSAAVLGLVLGTAGRGAAGIVVSDLGNPMGGFGQADEFGQAFINGAVAEMITNIQIQTTFGTVPGESLTLNARNADGTVGEQLLTFDGGSYDSSTSIDTFTPSGPFTLSAGTGYFVVLHGASGNQPFWDFAPPNPTSTSDNGSTLPPTSTWYITVGGSTTYGPLSDGPYLFQVNGTPAVANVPEPASLTLLGLGALGLLGYGWRRRKQAA
jgi:hypothetical protein